MTKNKLQHDPAVLPLTGAETLDGVQDGIDVRFTLTAALAAALARANHTGTQPLSSVAGLVDALAAKASDSAVVHNTGTEVIAGIKTFSASPVVPDGSWSIADTIGLQAALDARAADSAVVKLTGNQTIGGIKTFSSSPVVPDGSWSIADTSGLQLALDGKVATTGAETIAGVKTFSSSPIVPTPLTGTAAANRDYVDTITGAAGIRIEDEGSTVVATASGINFAGSGVTVTDAGSGEATVTIGPSAATGVFYVRAATGVGVTDRANVEAAITAALASGQTAAMIEFGGGEYDVGDLAIVLPKYGAGPQLTFRGPFLTTLNFSVDRGAGTWAVKGGALETDLYFHTFDGVGLLGPGARGTVGQPPVNIIGGGPTLMSGIWVGSRMKLRNGGVSGFRAGNQIMGNHIEFRSWNCPNNLDGVYWAQAYGNSGDVLFDNCALDGNLRSSHAVAPASIATFKMHKGHLGFSPYAIYFEAGRTGASALAMGGVILDGTSIEFCGNGFIFDPDQFARIAGFHCIQVGTWSTSPVTYRIPASAADSWIKVFEFSGVKFEGGMPQDGSVSGGSIDGPLFDFTGTVRMESDSWKSEYASVVAAAQPWMLSTLAPKVILTDTKDDSEARALKAAQTVTAGQVLEHNGQTTYAVRPYGHFGAGIRGIYAGVAMNGATGGTRTCVICVTKGDRIPVLIDTVAATSYHVVADGTVIGKVKGIVYDGTNTSTLGRPLIGEAYFGPLVASTTMDIHLTGAM